MNLPGLGPSAVDIQSHLYTSFLEARTSDLALHVRGTWEAIYRLHRVVLIQSGFFRSLFTAGFVESSPRPGYHDGPADIVIHFDDLNITRAAFEVCISRLYGGGPPLYIPPSLIPSTSRPLTPSFPMRPLPSETPDSHHPATPRFLLSLLATAVYLSIPSLASQALSSILSTVSPYTVLQYLDFALGKHIGALNPRAGEPDAAVGLEHIAHIIIIEEEEGAGGPSQVIKGKEKEDLSKPLHDFHFKREDFPQSPSSPSGVLYESSITSEDDVDKPLGEPSFHYGAISDKIGEACACWLARWATDLLPYEISEENASRIHDTAASSRKRAKSVPSGLTTSSNNSEGNTNEGVAIPLIWSRGGLSADWIAALVSADIFFIRGERERYDFARSVVELRRKGGIIEAEEEEWAKMFEHGIYYSNMSMEDVLGVSRDISPTTNQPFVPLSVIQAAHWSQSVLRHHITSRPTATTAASSLSASPSTYSSSSSTPSPRERELGIAHTTADILESISAANQADFAVSKPYFLVPADSSLRIGDTGNNFSDGTDGTPMSMDQLFTFTYSSNLSSLPSSPVPAGLNAGSTAKLAISESNFFGLLPPRYTASSCVLSDPAGKLRWSPYPPYRFAVEFWDLDALKEKSRLHSHTVCYAGSLFNIYVQIVRKKGQVQLGIYLHRQSSIDPIPPSSTPHLSITREEKGKSLNAGDTSTANHRLTHNRGPSLPSGFTLSTPTTATHYSPSIHPPSRSTTPLSYQNYSTSPPSPSVSGSPSSLSSSTMSSNALPATAPPVMPPQPYRDPRPSISAYFTISCASATGSSQTRFTSSPDVFSISQSWGWKSSSLRTEEYLNVGSEYSGTDSATKSKEVSFRATVVLGLV